MHRELGEMRALRSSALAIGLSHWLGGHLETQGALCAFSPPNATIRLVHAEAQTQLRPAGAIPELLNQRVQRYRPGLGTTLGASAGESGLACGMFATPRMLR